MTSLAETPDGKIWMGTLGAGLFYVTQSQVTRITAGLPQRKINCMLSVGNNELWVGTDRGLFRWNGKVLSRSGLPARFGNLQVLTMLQDRESNVWVGTVRGLLRINAKGVSFSDESSLGGRYERAGTHPRQCIRDLHSGDRFAIRAQWAGLRGCTEPNLVGVHGWGIVLAWESPAGGD